MPAKLKIDKHIGPFRYTLDEYRFWHTLSYRKWGIAVQRFFDRSGWEIRLAHNICNGLNIEVRVERERFTDRLRKRRERRRMRRMREER